MQFWPVVDKMGFDLCVSMNIYIYIYIYIYIALRPLDCQIFGRGVYKTGRESFFVIFSSYLL